MSLGKDPRDPEFWRKLDQLKGLPAADALIPGSWAALDRAWRGFEAKGVKPSREWAALQPGTRAIYSLRMRRVVETWAGLQVSLTDVAGIAALRDTIDGAVAANQLVKVIRAAMKWGRAHGYPSADPAAGLPPRDEGEVEGATPWPEWAYQIIVNEAPEPLRRAASRPGDRATALRPGAHRQAQSPRRRARVPHSEAARQAALHAAVRT